MKILVVRFSAIGDIVLTTPVLRCLKEQTKAEIHFLTKVNFKTVVEANPHIDYLHVVQRDFKEILVTLRTEKFDYIIDLQHNMHTWRLKRALRVPTFAFPKLNVEKWLLVNTKINRLPNVHIVERYMAATAKLGVKNDGKGLEYYVPDIQRVDLATKSPFGEKPYVAVVTGAAHATKRMPVDKIIHICKQLDYPIVLLGGKDEVESGAFIASASGEHVWNTCGQFNLHQSASIVQQARVVLTHDTGLMHIAAAFAKNIVSVWGNTIPGFGMYPYLPQGGKNISIEELDLGCRPCSKIGHEHCPRGHFRCMNDLAELRIVEAVRSLWTVE